MSSIPLPAVSRRSESTLSFSRWLNARKRQLVTAGVAALALCMSGAAVSSASTAYVSSGSGSGSSFVQQIDLTFGSVLPGISVGSGLGTLALAEDEETLYVARSSGGTNQIVPVDVASGTAGTPIAAPAPIARMGLTIDGNELWATSGSSTDNARTKIYRYDLVTSAWKPVIELGDVLAGREMAFSPDGTTAYLIAGSVTLMVYPINVADGTIGTPIELASSQQSPRSLAISEDGKTLLVGTSAGGGIMTQIVPVALPTGTLGTPFVGAATQAFTAVRFKPGTNRVYAVSGQATGNLVTLDVDTATNAITQVGSAFPITGRADSMRLSRTGGLAYIGSLTPATLAPIDLSGPSALTVIDVTALDGISDIAIADGEEAEVEDPTIASDPGQQSGVVGDPTNPTVSIDVAQRDGDDLPVPSGDLAVTAASSNPSVIASSGVTIAGTGAKRTVSFNPVGPGVSDVTLTVTGADDKTATTSINYAVSKATTPTSRVLQSNSDLSTAIDVGDGQLLIADDEYSDLRLFRSDRSGMPVKKFDVGDAENGGGEIDFEASAQSGDSVYWLGSHGNNKDGLIEPSRHTVIRTRVTGTGDEVAVSRTGSYGGLRRDLTAWDHANGDRYGIANADGGGTTDLNIEGAEFAPDGKTLYLGFRFPNVFTGPQAKALIVPVTNISRVVNGTDERAEFGEPLELELDGGTIREIRRNKSGQYVILSAVGDNHDQALWSWTGEHDDAPIRLTTVVPKSTEQYDDAPGAWEAIGAIPDVLTPGASIQLIMDQGYERLYVPAFTTKNKQLTTPQWKKTRLDTFTLTGNVGAAVQAQAPTFAPQATGTTGPGKWVTITNSGSQKLKISDVRVRAVDEDSAGEFLIGEDTCEDETIVLGETCTVLVRFSPARENATSTANLVLKANVAGGEALVPLSGTSTSLPAGPAGPTGATGGNGATSATGATGTPGTPGTDGQNGAPGSKGDKGDAGPQGPQGPAGLNGKDGSFSFAATSSKTATVRRGRTATVSFTVRNNTTSTLGSSTATASVPKSLKVSGKPSVRVGSLNAGQQRTLRLKLKVGKSAKVGTHKVKVTLKVGGRNVVRTVSVRVTK